MIPTHNKTPGKGIWMLKSELLRHYDLFITYVLLVGYDLNSAG